MKRASKELLDLKAKGARRVRRGLLDLQVKRASKGLLELKANGARRDRPGQRDRQGLRVRQGLKGRQGLLDLLDLPDLLDPLDRFAESCGDTAVAAEAYSPSFWSVSPAPCFTTKTGLNVESVLDTRVYKRHQSQQRRDEMPRRPR